MALTGQLTLNETLLIEVDADPSTSGVAAPIGSIATLDDGTNGRVWIKSGAANTAWAIITRHVDGTQLTQGGVLYASAQGFVQQNAASFFWDITNGRLGIGNNAPATALHVGTATASMQVTPGWSGGTGTWINLDTTGPSGIGTGGPGANPFIALAAGAGQWFTDSLTNDIAYRNTSGRLLWGINGNNSGMRFDNTGIAGGSLTIGPAGSALTNNPLSVNGTVNNFLQSNVQNTQAGTTASSDVVATADNGTDTTNFINMGVNSSAWADPTFTINGPNDGYIYVQGGDLSIGTGSANNIIFFTGDTLAANERMRISATGNVGIGTNNPQFPLHVNGNVLFGGTPPTVIPTAPLNLINNAAGTLRTQLNLVNTGGGGGAGSAIDFFTYDIAGGTAPGLRIGGVDNNFSADFVISTKAPGAATNALVDRMRITNNGSMLLGTSIDNGVDLFQLSRTGSVNFSMLECFDDCNWTTAGSGTNPYGVIAVVATGGTMAPETTPSTGQYHGLLNIATGTTNNATGAAAADYFNGVGKIRLGINRIFIEKRVAVPVLSTAGVNFNVVCGLSDTATTGTPVNGVYFSYNHAVNGGAWTGTCTSASTSSTVVGSAVAAATWYTLRAEINATRTSVSFFVNGVSIGTVTTNIPAATINLRPVSKINKQTTATATSSILQLDYAYWKMFR